jgi:hypothetical protein
VIELELRAVIQPSVRHFAGTRQVVLYRQMQGLHKLLKFLAGASMGI